MINSVGRYKGQPSSWLWSCILLFTLPDLNESLSTNQPLQLQQSQSPLLPQPLNPDIVQAQPSKTININTGSANNNKLIGSINSINPLIQAIGISNPADISQAIPDAGPTVGQSPIATIIPPKQVGSPTVEPGVAGALSYGPEDPIMYLDYSTIHDEILRKNTANFVYFNANFNNCRHCHKFFTVWRDLAVDIRWWRQVVRLFAINCSDEDNIDTCRRIGVTQFPQVKYYWIQSGSLDRDGQRLRILGKSVHAMRHLIMDKVLDSYLEHNKILAQQNAARQGAKSPPQSVVAPTGFMNSAGGSLSPINSLLGPMMSQFMGNNTTSGLMSMLSSLSTGTDNLKTPATPLVSSNPLDGLISGKTPVGLNQMMEMFLSSVPSARQQFTIQALPSNWPELDPIEVTDTQLLISTLPLNASKNIGALIIMETQEFLYTGLEVMLDLSPYSNSTYIARVRDDRSQLSKNLTRRDDIQAPSLIYIQPQGEARLLLTAPKYTNDEDLRRAFVRAFERRQVKYPVRRVWSASSTVNQPSVDNTEDEDLITKKAYQVYMDDLTNAIRASLMEQVFRHLDLSDDQYNALVKYVYTLINYFPFNNDESIKFFKRLHGWLQNQVSPVDINEYKKQFHDIDEIFQQRDWIACKSLSNTNAIPSRGRKPTSLFENPAQLGKMVSNLTRLFRGQQQQETNKLKNLLTIFSSNAAPVRLNQSQKLSAPNNNLSQTSKTSDVVASFPTIPSSPAQLVTTVEAPQKATSDVKLDDSPIERIITSLTNGSLGTDSSILKLITTALTGSSSASGVQGGKSKFAREYPCGAWRLAHVMSVNEYIKDSPRKDVRHIVLHSLYQYMLHFYACPTCGNRISDVMSEFRLNLDEHLVDQADSVLLLWKIHNRVNKRLEAEPRHGSPPKSQFPNEQQCPKCRAPRTQSDLISTPNWHERQVLNFLVHHYRPQSIIISAGNQTSAASSLPALTRITISWPLQRGSLLNQAITLHFGLIHLLSALSSYWWLFVCIR